MIIPAGLPQYRNVDISNEIIAKAWDVFGISALKPYQMLVMYRIVEQERFEVDRKKDQIVILPTGTGKTLCFFVPALMCSGITVVVYPLLSLMNDQIRKLKEAGVECVNIRGGQDREQRKNAFKSIGKAKIVVTNPETLSQKQVLRELKKHKISLFVCDEAHVIAKWGESFRPAYLELGKAVEELNPKQVLAFTATASDQTVEFISKCLFRTKPLLVRGDADRENIFYQSHLCLNRKFGLMEVLSKCKKPALIFCRTRDETYENCCESRRILKNKEMFYYNAELSKKEREAIEKRFLNSTGGVLFATSAYGMGVDKKDIRTVVHYNLPDDAEEYLQESGRAGRDGKRADAYVLVTPEDKESQNELVKVFANSCCRRTSLLALLGQQKDECTGCDYCDNKVMEKATGDDLIRKAVKYYPFRFNAISLSQILCGLDYEQKYSLFYGKMRDYDQNLVFLSVISAVASEKIKESDSLLYPNVKCLCIIVGEVKKIRDAVHRISGKIQSKIRTLTGSYDNSTGKN